MEIQQQCTQAKVVLAKCMYAFVPMQYNVMQPPVTQLCLADGSGCTYAGLQLPMVLLAPINVCIAPCVII